MTSTTEHSRSALLKQLDQATTNKDAARQLQTLEQLETELSLEHEQPNETDKLTDDPFPFVEALCPFLGSRSAHVRQAAQVCLTRFVNGSSPKEMAIALSERLARFKDAGSDGDDTESSNETTPGQTAPDHVAPTRQIEALADAYVSALQRIKTQKPNMFLSSAIDSVISAMRVLASTGHSFTAILQVSAKFAQSLAKSSWVEPTRQQCLNLLQRFLLQTVALVHAGMPSGLAHRFLISIEPKYQLPPSAPQAAEEDSQATDQAWLATTALAQEHLELNTAALVQLARDHAVNDEGIAAVVLLAHIVAERQAELHPIGNTSFVQDLADTRPLIMASLLLHTEGTINADEPLFLLSYVLRGVERSRETLEDEDVFLIVEFLSAVSSQSQDVNIRFAAYRQLAAILTRLIEKEEVLVMVLRDLVLECPYEPMRAASISLIREVMAHKFAQSRDSILLSPLFWHELGTQLFKAPPQDEAINLQVELSRLQEILSLLYLLLGRDKLDLTRTKSKMPQIWAKLLEPVRARMSNWSNDREVGPLTVEMLQASLDRIGSVL
ncbi:hypothetical protein ACM66B_002338 [Microbotryomycetes sp. NB124-2]